MAGEDGLIELGRVSMAWTPNGAARTLAVACGGTVGDRACVQVAACWSAAGAGTHFATAGADQPVVWNERSCPGVEAGSPGDEQEPGAGGETGAPDVSEPGPIDGE